MPSRSATSDPLYEDLSHATWNLLFMLTYSQYYKEQQVFTCLDDLQNTLNSIMSTKYSRFIKTGNQESFQFFPGFSWSMLNNQQQEDALNKSIPTQYIFNDFDNTSGLTYLLAIKSTPKNFSFAIFKYDEIANIKTYTLDIKQLIDCFIE